MIVQPKAPVPPFPLPFYPCYINRLRHWIAAQGTRTWTTDEAAAAVEGKIHIRPALKRLLSRDEIVVIGVDTYRAGDNLWDTWEDDAKDVSCATITNMVFVSDAMKKYNVPASTVRGIIKDWIEVHAAAPEAVR